VSLRPNKGLIGKSPIFKLGKKRMAFLYLTIGKKSISAISFPEFLDDRRGVGEGSFGGMEKTFRDIRDIVKSY
jgi:hypothetical protein